MNEDKKKFDKIAYNNAFNAQAYDRINIAVKKGDRKRYQEHAEQNRGSNLTRLIIELLEKDIEEYSNDLTD